MYRLWTKYILINNICGLNSLLLQFIWYVSVRYLQAYYIIQDYTGSIILKLYHFNNKKWMWDYTCKYKGQHVLILLKPYFLQDNDFVFKLIRNNNFFLMWIK